MEFSDLPVPKNEEARIAALKSYEILDTKAEERFDNLTKLASEICQAPVCLISLIDENRQWFKSKVGIDAEFTAREISFCQHAIMGTKVFEVENALEDERFKNNNLVQEDPNIRFYAGSPLIDDDGFALGTLCVIDDKPKKLEPYQLRALNILAKEVVSAIQTEKLKKDKEIYKKFFEMSIDCLCIAGTDGYMTRLNSAFPKLLGYSEKEILSRPFSDFIHPDDIKKTENIVAKLAEGHDVVAFQNRYIAKSGNIISLSWNTSVDKTTGELFAVAHDITEIKDTLSKLERLNKDLDEFAYIISHDLKAPLLAIETLSEFLQEDLADKLNESTQETFNLLKSRVKKMDVLIQGVLDYSRSSHDSKTKTEVNVKTIITDIIECLDFPSSTRFVIQDNLPTLLFNKVQLQQVFQNLISNAIKYGDKEAAVIEVGWTETQLENSFFIKDNGPGIDQKHHNRVFNIFHTLDHKSDINNSGIGLSIAKKIIQANEGEIYIDNETTQGAKFVFSLPKS